MRIIRHEWSSVIIALLSEGDFSDPKLESKARGYSFDILMVPESCKQLIKPDSNLIRHVGEIQRTQIAYY